MKREALALVEAIFDKLVRKADVLDHLRRETKISEQLRTEALTLAEQYLQNPGQLNNASWNVVRQPGAKAAAYHQALLRAEVACLLEAENGFYLNTLGVAQYRLGQYQAAVETLTRSEKLNATPADGSHPSDLAFLAMAQYQLGHKEQAQATLTRLREAMTTKNPEKSAFLREVETLMEAAPATKK